MLVKDQLNRTLQFQQPPNRIISLVPSQTELLVDLGLRSKIVGVTKFCVHPKELRKEVTVVGGTKMVDLEKIRSLNPDIIICNKEENTKEIVEQCAEFASVWVSDIYTVEDSMEMVSNLGEIFSVEEKALEISKKINSEMKKFSSWIKNHPVRNVAYLIWKKPYMAAGCNTFINAMLQLNNFDNIFSETNSRYPQIELEDLKAADLVVVSSEPFPFKETDVQELKKVLQTEVLLVDGEYFSWYGSRLQQAFSYFKTLH
jgi:ABC-type Fe3+-hydroxamate transport system substrate-binding protein